MTDFSPQYSVNSGFMRKSVIRELLKLTQKPDIISFAGGLPSPDTFPADDLAKAAAEVFASCPAKALQYGTTEGDPDLVRELIAYEERHGTVASASELLVTSASQQALDLIPRIFIDPGDYAIAGRPTYIGAIQALQAYQGRVLGVPFSPEGDGFDFDELERIYASAIAAGARVKYIYVIPDFQNPTGICWSLEKRRAILEFALRERLFIVEDAPYREIRFKGAQLPSIYQLDQESGGGHVIGLKTFSKILAPGTRVGWIMAREDLIDKLVTAKQAMDLCTSPFTQAWLAAYLRNYDIENVVARTRALYASKRDFMLERLEADMPEADGLTWTKPEGGLFLWISLPPGADTDAMFYRAIERKVAYVVGSAFYFDRPELNSMRINFSYSSFNQIEEGICRLSEVVAAELRK
jgi:2-aminoadipate transaminase